MPSLPILFRAVAVIKAVYALLALLTPPDLVLAVTGWNLSADGHWIVKLLGATLGFQAVIAWMFRNDPHRGVAYALAGYQTLAATIDWVMWLVLADRGVFANALGKSTVIASIGLHYGFALLIFIALRKAKSSTT